MADRVAAAEGGKANAGRSATGTGARLGDGRVQVSHFQGAAARACRRCGGPLPTARNTGTPRVWCLACKPPKSKQRHAEPCIGCGGDVGPLQQRGRMRRRCAPCRARMGNECARRRYARNAKWNRPRGCLICGKEFVPRCPPDHARLGCYECGRAGEHRRTIPCEDCGTALVSARGSGRCQRCVNRRRARSSRSCRRCGVTFVPKTRDRVSFCSRECAYALHRALRVAREQRLAEARDVLVEGTCCECGGWFALSRKRRFCSERCRVHRAKTSRRGWYRPAPRARRACAECGGAVEVPGRARRRYCSKRCSDRVFRRNRRAAKRRAWRGPVGRAAIVRKYRLHCAICGLPIVSYAGSSWREALDHIVPLACGGLHHEENVQLAHVMCNSFKGAETPRWRERLWRRIRTDSPFAHWCRMEAADG